MKSPNIEVTKVTTYPGKLVVLDGTDGSGKATQTALLARELELNEIPYKVFDFPRYGSKSAGMVEEYLNGKYGQVNAKATSIFYAVDRFDASQEIKKELAVGTVVITNRYVSANAAHQGGKIEDKEERVKFFKWLNELEYEIFGIPKPDLNIILHVPAEVAQSMVDKKDESARQYVNGKKRDLHEADLNHLKNAEQVYIEIAKLFPNTKLVECMQDDSLMTPEQIHNKVWELVRRIALKGLIV